VGLLALPALGGIAEEAKYFDWETVAASRAGNDQGTTAVSQTGEFFLDELEGVPRGIATLPLTAFGPMVWNWSNYGLFLSGLDGLLWLGMAVLAFVGVRNSALKANAVVCAVPLVLLLVYLGIGLANYGLLMRIRGVGVPFLAPLAALGIVYMLDRRAVRASNRLIEAAHRITPRHQTVAAVR
jgi:hypothetical protein